MPAAVNRTEVNLGEAFLSEARGIGCEALSDRQIALRDAGLLKQIQIGVNRSPSVEPNTLDGGVLASRMPIPPGVREAFDRVPKGPASTTYVFNAGGTNWDTFRLEKDVKDDKASIAIKQVDEQKFDENVPKPVTWDKFVTMMAEGIKRGLDKHAEDNSPDGRVNIGINFGFPTTNIRSENGIDAVAKQIKEDGKWIKGWQITDWPELDPDTRGNLTKDLREKLIDTGVDVGHLFDVFPKPGAMVAINDTNGVGLDAVAIETALINEEFRRIVAEDPLLQSIEVVNAGMVGGTGTNTEAADINLETGHAKFLYSTLPHPTPGDIDSTSREPEDIIHKEMVADESLPIHGEPEFEHETGMAIRFRIATALRLLKRKQVLDTGDEVAQTLLDTVNGNPKLLDDMATSDETDPRVKYVISSQARRAAENYGILIANTLRAANGFNDLDPTKLHVLLAEGSVIHKGKIDKGLSIKRHAEEVASKLLGVQVRVAEAQGIRGTGTLAMSYNYLEGQAA